MSKTWKKMGKNLKSAETHWRNRCSDMWQWQWTWMIFWDFRRKSGRKKQIEEESAFFVWIAEACQSLFCTCLWLWLQLSCCLFLWWEIAVKCILLLQIHCQNLTLQFLTDYGYLSLNWPPYGRHCCGEEQAPWMVTPALRAKVAACGGTCCSLHCL